MPQGLQTKISSAPNLAAGLKRVDNRTSAAVYANINRLQAVTVAEDEVDLAPRRTEIGRQKLQALALELLFGGAFRQFAMAEVERLVGPTPPRLNARCQIHAMP